jgi:anti-sigma factor RsiW
MKDETPMREDQRIVKEHHKLRDQLSLAASGALRSDDEQRVLQHAESCDECAAELAEWRMLTGGLRRLPTPQPRGEIVERALALAQIRLGEEAEYRSNRRVMAFLLAFAWLLTLASWPVFHMVTSGVLLRIDPRFNQTWLAFAALSCFLWGTGGVAAVLLARQRQSERRMA